MLVEENKTEKVYRKELTARFRAALDLALKIPGHPFEGTIVHNQEGDPYTRQGWHANWKRWMKRVPVHLRFKFVEIRHKAITDAKGNKQAFSMHSDGRMLRVYDHEVPTSPSHDWSKE